MIDLHVHSTCSDGTLTPRELVDYATNHDITAFALTDHDSVAGLAEAISYAKDKNVTVIPGIELSTENEGRDIHIVGLFIDYENEAFLSHLTHFIDSRTARNYKMCELLRDAGIDITYEELSEAFPDSVITRAHYAKYMLNKGYVKSLHEAFERYVGDHAPCFVPRQKVTPEQGIDLIHQAGGIAILAHPTLYRMGKDALNTLVARLKAAGLDGIEGFYATYSPAETRMIHNIAKTYHLAISGGSDFHGTNKPDLQFGTGYGKLYIHEEVLEKLRELI